MQYRNLKIIDMEFKGKQRAEAYAECKSSSSVFKENHVKDYLSGYNQALKDSKAPEMLEILKEVHECGYEFSNWGELDNLIKQATEI